MLWGYPASAYWEATVNPIGMIIGAVIMFGVLGFLPGWVIAKILNGMGKLRIPREVEIAGLDYEFAESARKDQHAVSALEK
jgi:ammonia channel protein AmtB